MSAVNPKHPARCGCAQCHYLEALVAVAEQPCVCDSPRCGCSDPSVAICRTCGGRTSLRLSAKNAPVCEPPIPTWEKRTRYAEAALRTILGSPGITLDGAQAIAQNYFDGLSATGATVSDRTDTPIAQQSGKSGIGEGDHADGAVQRACAGDYRAAPMSDPLLAAERKLSIMHAAVLRAIVEIEAEFPHERPEWVGNVRQMLNDAHCAMFPDPTPRA